MPVNCIDSGSLPNGASGNIPSMYHPIDRVVTKLMVLFVVVVVAAALECGGVVVVVVVAEVVAEEVVGMTSMGQSC
jgi:hypothetical protein